MAAANVVANLNCEFVIRKIDQTANTQRNDIELFGLNCSLQSFGRSSDWILPLCREILFEKRSFSQRFLVTGLVVNFVTKK